MIEIKQPSPISRIVFDGFEIDIKRDDLLHPDFSGNKARKFIYFLEKELNHIKKIVSFGSNQSNAMYSLSVLCKDKSIEFQYYIDHIPSHLLNNPIGNFKDAIKNGMKIAFFKDCPYDFLKNLSKTLQIEDTLFIPEGGRCETSKYGIKGLAKEIISYKELENIKNLKIFLPSGTGTTALFLQQSLQEYLDNSKVYTVACVGGEEYLKNQFFSLCEDETSHPIILKTKKYHFGKLDCKLYKFWIELRQKTGIEFDLLYDPIGFSEMMKYIKNNSLSNKDRILYIHQGGIKGNDSMIPRYKRKCGEDIQYKR